MEYVLIKSVGPKSCELNHEGRGLENIFLPFSSSGGGDRWCRHLSSLVFHRANSHYHLKKSLLQGYRRIISLKALETAGVLTAFGPTLLVLSAILLV
ncbi:hypothetical protein TNCV_2866081 [Trichonephila clavipes]|nr:hypothetical protein TNCV_2866081 [Trichonephila clavipes]